MRSSCVAIIALILFVSPMAFGEGGETVHTSVDKSAIRCNSGVLKADVDTGELSSSRGSSSSTRARDAR